MLCFPLARSGVLAGDSTEEVARASDSAAGHVEVHNSNCSCTSAVVAPIDDAISSQPNTTGSDASQAIVAAISVDRVDAEGQLCRKQLCNNCCGCFSSSRCSRCRMVYYCSASCQKQDWKRAHRYLCLAHAKPSTDDVSKRTVACSVKIVLNSSQTDQMRPHAASTSPANLSLAQPSVLAGDSSDKVIIVSNFASAQAAVPAPASPGISNATAPTIDAMVSAKPCTGDFITLGTSLVRADLRDFARQLDDFATRSVVDIRSRSASALRTLMHPSTLTIVSNTCSGQRSDFSPGATVGTVIQSLLSWTDQVAQNFAPTRRAKYLAGSMVPHAHADATDLILSTPWTDVELQLLDIATRLFPSGVLDRWCRTSAFISRQSEQKPRTPEECQQLVAKFRDPDDSFFFNRPFSLDYRLREVEFSEGIGTAWTKASSGEFGRVLVGRIGGMNISMKLLRRREFFLVEAEMLLFLRGKIDSVLELQSRGIAPSIADIGARNISYVYGTGYEADLSAVGSSLPSEEAYTIAMRPLKCTLTEAYLSHNSVVPSIKRLLLIAHDIALALAFLSHRGIVHSDIKPSNIMLDFDDRAVLIDFGLSRRLGIAGPVALGDLFDLSGTLVYIAPELLRLGHAATLSSDVYSYGILLWCLFSGRLKAWADESMDVMEIKQLVSSGRRPDMQALRKDAPKDVVELMRRCWAHDPSERPTALFIAQTTHLILSDGGDGPMHDMPPLSSFALYEPMHDNLSYFELQARLTTANAIVADIRSDADRRIQEAAKVTRVGPARVLHIAQLRELLRECIQDASTSIAPMIFGHTHSSTCNHAIAGPSDVWQSALLGDLPLLSRSLERGGSTEEVNENEETALMTAARHGNFDAARVLLDAGADVTSRSKNGSTALHFAATLGFSNIVRMLLQHPGVEVNVRQQDGFTPLHGAASQGHARVVRTLLSSTFLNVNAASSTGATSLHEAVRGNRISIICLLLSDLRTDIEYHDHAGLTALSWARFFNYKEATSLLQAESSFL